MELHNVTELYVFSERTFSIGSQAHNSTTAIVSCCCTLLHSTWSSDSITNEFTCEVYYLADWTSRSLQQLKIIQRKLLCSCASWARWRQRAKFDGTFSGYDGTEQCAYNEITGREVHASAAAAVWYSRCVGAALVSHSQCDFSLRGCSPTTPYQRHPGHCTKRTGTLCSNV